jgi:hypothetical protein
VLWFSVDDTYSTVYFPVYCGVTEVPYNFAVGTGSFHDVTPDSAFWVFNRVSNFAYSRYSDMIQDIQVVQRELESKYLAAQPDVDAAAAVLYEQAPQLAKDYLTDYSLEAGRTVVERWTKLSDFLLYKYLDGNVKDEHGKVTHPGYPESWYRMVAEASGDHLRVRKLQSEIEREEAEREEARRFAEGVLTLLDARDIEIDEAERQRVLDCEDREKLQTWLTQATTASSARELFSTE